MPKGYLELRIEDPEHVGQIIVAKGETIENRDPLVFIMLVKEVADRMARQSIEIVQERRKAAV